MTDANITIDYWHYSRHELAEQLLTTFEHGLSSALVFFAPRRMGKTEFLRKDMQPMALAKGWQVCYFSFLDCAANPTSAFTDALMEMMVEQRSRLKLWKKLANITKVSALGVAVERQAQVTEPHFKDLLRDLAKREQPTLLLLDEVQALGLYKQNATFIASLRTALDMYKDNIKVVFTGSSQTGLRHMFSKAEAPFFHFGQSLLFPELDRGFTQHLARIFTQVTQRQIDENELWKLFQSWHAIPQLIRALVERLVLDPSLSIEQASEALSSDLFDEKIYMTLWSGCSPLEQLLLKHIAHKKTALFAKQERQIFATHLGLELLPISTIQSALRTLQRKRIIGKLEGRGHYDIEDQYLVNWLQKQTDIPGRCS